MATITRTGTNGTNGTSGVSPTAGTNGTDAPAYTLNGTIGADSTTVIATGGNGGTGGNGTGVPGANGGNGGNASVTLNGNIFNAPASTSILVSLNATGGNGGAGGTGTTPGTQGKGGNATITANGNIFQPNKALTSVEIDAFAVGGTGSPWGNASSTINGNVFQSSKAIGTVTLHASATGQGTNTATLNGNIVQNNVNNVFLAADATPVNGTASLSGNIVQTGATNTGTVSFEASGNHISITNNKVTLGLQEFDFTINPYSPYDTTITGNQFKGLGSNKFVFTENPQPGPHTDTLTIDMTAGTMVFDGQASNTFTGFSTIVVAGSGVNATIVGSSGADTLTGGDGNDTFTGGMGNDTINGGNGIDTAIFSGNFAQYSFAPFVGNNGTVTDTVAGRDGTDTLTSIEFLKFNDGTYNTTTNTFTPMVPLVINHAPAGTDKTITSLEDAVYTFTTGDFGFTDPNDAPPNQLQAVKITTLPVTGVLKDNGVAVTAGQSIAVADITGGLLTFTPAANANGAANAAFTFQVQDNGGTGGGGQDTDQSPNTITFNITAVNDAPVGTPNTITILEDGSHTFTTGEFGFTDPNDSPANTLLAVKITTLPANGTLKDNGVAVTAGQFVSATDIAGGLLVFTPAANGNGNGYGNFTFQVQDNGGTANTGVDTDTTARLMTVNVTAVNDAPVLDASKSPVLNGEAQNAPAPSGAVGTLVSALVDLTTPPGGLDNVTDPDTGALTGIALSGTHTTNGSWFYSTDNGANWTAVGAVSEASALLLKADANTRLYFQPNPGYNGTDASAITFHAWDQTSGTAATTVDLTVVGATGGATAYSTATDTASLSVTGANTAPVLDASKSPTLATELEDAPTAFGPVGTLVSSLVDLTNPAGGLDNVTDPDTTTTTGLALSGTNTTNGSWFYSTDNGANWTAVGAVSEANALLLKADANTRLYFKPNANYNGTDSGAITFHAWDQTSGTAGTTVDLTVVGATGGSTAYSTATDTAALTITSVNDAPAGTDKTITSFEDTTYAFTAADFGFTDPNDSPANTLLAVKISTLPLTGTLKDNGVAVTAGQSIAVADITGGLLTFTPAANANGSPNASFTFQVQDNGGTTNGGVDLDQSPNTITFNITAVNDAPVGTPGTITMLEDGSHTFTTGEFGFTDPNDSPANSLLAVKITTLPANGTLKDNGVAVTAGQFVSAADIAGGLLVFTPAANANGASYGNFTFQVQDNGGTANGGVDTDTTARLMTVNVTSVNDAPTGANTTKTILEDNTYTLAAADFGFTDPNDSPANTLLAVKIATLPLTGTLKDNGVAVTAGQSIAVADIIGGLLTFTPAANSTASAQFTFQVQDNGGTANGGVDLDPTPKTFTFNITPVNDAPVGTPATITLLEDGTHTFTTGDFGFTDPNDSPANSLLAVKITTVPANGILLDNGVVVTAGQFVSATDIAGGLLSFIPASNANGANYGNFTFQVQDNGGTANGGVDTDTTARLMTVNVTSVNDAPLSFNNTVTTLEDNTYTFSASDFPFLDLADTPANNLAAVRITSLPLNGTLKDNGVAVVANQSISVANINAGLLTFTPAANANGAGYASFGFVVQDDGGLANGGADTSTVHTLTVNVTPVNDAPVGTPATINSAPNTPYTFTTGNFGFTDPNDSPANSLLAVEITTLPANGTLTDNGVAVTAGQFVSAADIAGGLLVFTPAANATGNGYGNFTFQVQDNGGTANGGVDTDTTPRLMTFNVLAINHAPAGTDKLITSFEDTTYTLTTADFGFSDPNDTPANTLAGVKITTLPASGTLFDNGVAVTAGQTVSAADISGGLLTFTPAGNSTNPVQFTFQVQDNGGTANGGQDTDQSPNTITFSITPVNDAPVGTPGTVTLLEDGSHVFTTGEFGFTDPNDTPANMLQAVKITTLPANGSLTDNGVAVTAGQFVSATDIAGGLLVFTPAANANGAGYGNFTFQVQDDGGTSNGGVNTDPTARLMTVNVTAVNDAPVAADDTYSTDLNTALVIPAGTGVLANDTDIDTPHASLVVGGATSPANGVLTLNPDGSFTYTPNNGFSGTDTFTYQTSDGSALSNTATVTITVNPGSTITGPGMLTGTNGDDTFIPVVGTTDIDGGNNTAIGDTVVFSNATSGITSSTDGAQDWTSGGLGMTTLTNIENLTGSDFDDVLSGTDGVANKLMGGNGNDTLIATTGAGGIGDTLDGGAGSDTADFSNSVNGVSVDLGAVGVQTVGGDIGDITLVSIENVIGTVDDDFFQGTSGDNSFDGGTGGNDTVSYGNATADGLVANLMLGTASGGGVGNDTLINIENLTGSLFADTLIGDAGANTLNGADGNDILFGHGGANLIAGGDGTDVAYYAGREADPAYTTVNLTQVVGGPEAVNDNLTGIERLKFLSPTHVMDVNNDGTGDVIIQSNTTGNLTIHTQPMGTITVTGVGSNWKAVGTGQFNPDADRAADVLLQDTGTGNLEIITGLGVTNTVTPLSTQPGSTAWKAITTGDFNGDASSDVLLQNQTTGAVQIMFLDKGSNVPTDPVEAIGTVDGVSTIATPGANWKAIAAGDFNGDGKSDILWQNSSTKQVEVYLMDGANVTNTPTAQTATGLTAIGTGDFNGDGTSDILFQNASGQAVIWLMNGDSHVSTRTIAKPASGTWNVTGAEDIDKNGVSDIIWTNNATGIVAATELTAATATVVPMVTSFSPSTQHLVASTGGG